MYNPEDLAAWYLRLNGYLAIPNFILHRADGGQRTEVDIIGARFPFRDEFGAGNVDDPSLGFDDHRLHVILVEVKRTDARLNAAWTQEGARNVSDMLRAIGVAPPPGIDDLAVRLCRDGIAGHDGIVVSFVVVGERLPDDVREEYPMVPFRSWNDVLQFIFGRFSRFDRMKSQNDQWERAGRTLWDL